MCVSVCVSVCVCVCVCVCTTYSMTLSPAVHVAYVHADWDKADLDFLVF